MADIEDRLLVIEARLEHLATKTELVATQLDMKVDLAKLHDDIRTWYFAGWTALLIAVVASHFLFLK